MLKVYNFMASGVLLTGIIALISFKISVVTNASGSITGFTSFGNALFFSGLKWIVMLAPLRNSILYEFWNKKNERC